MKLLGLLNISSEMSMHGRKWAFWVGRLSRF
jgi:hypothetical protein